MREGHLVTLITEFNVKISRKYIHENFLRQANPNIYKYFLRVVFYLFLFFNEGVTVVLILSILNFMEVLIDIFHLVLNVNLIKINPKTQGH